MSKKNLQSIIPASPKVRKFARELGVDIKNVKGSERENLGIKYTIQLGVYKKSNQNIYKYIHNLEKKNIYVYLKYLDKTIELYCGRFITFKDAKNRLKKIKKVVKDAYIKGL